MRWLGIIIVLSLVAGLVAAYVPASLHGSGEEWITDGTTRTGPTMNSAVVTTPPTRTYLARIGCWELEVRLSQGQGTLTARYVGDKPLEIEDTLLPLTAGLELLLRYADGREDVVEGSGTRYVNTGARIVPGEEDTLSFNAEDLDLILVRGSMPDGTPINLVVPVSQAARRCWPRVTVTVTTTITVAATNESEGGETSEIPECVVDLAASYPEPSSGETRRLEEANATVFTNGILEVRVPSEVEGRSITLILYNPGTTPILVSRDRMEVTIINVSTDRTNYFDLGFTYYIVIPTVTLSPLPPSCADKVPWPYRLVYPGSLDILKPGDTLTLQPITIPKNIEGLEDADEAWFYIKVHINYWPIKEIYRIGVISNDTSHSHQGSYLLVSLYSGESLDIIFRVHAHLAPG